MGIISIKNLVHRFSKYGDNGEEIGEKTALEQVSLDIEKEALLQYWVITAQASQHWQNI